MAIIIVYILIVFFSGTLVKKYVTGISDYLVADRSMSLNLGLISMMCTEIGMITYIYYAEMGYKAGFAALTAAFPPMIAYWVLGKTGFIIKPLLEMKIMTIPEFFSKRFTKGVRFYVGIVMAVGGILNFGVFPGVEAKFVNIVTGIPQEHVLLTMVVLLTVVMLYTLVGGMVSVIITNYVQYVLLSFGMVFITVAGVLKVNWSTIVETVRTAIGEKGLNPFWPSLTGGDFGLDFLIWQTLLWASLLVGWQAISMRLFSSKSSKVGQKIYTWSGLMFLGRAVLPIFWGIMALALLGPGLSNSLDSLPLFILKVVPKGLLGLIFAALLAASMSTYSSYLLSWSSVASQDIIGSIVKFITKKEISNKNQMIISRVTMAAVMIFIIWWSLFHDLEGYLYFYLGMTAMLFIPGVLIGVGFGIYWKKANAAGAYTAFTLALLPPLAYLFFTKELEKWASMLGWGGFLLAVIGMIAGTLIYNWFKPQAVKESA